jgi:hypothetical protein
MLHDFPIRVVFFFVEFVVLVGIGATEARNFMSAIEAIAVEASLAVVAVLVVAFFVVLWLAVVRTAVESRPFFAADVAKAVATFASARY